MILYFLIFIYIIVQHTVEKIILYCTLRLETWKLRTSMQFASGMVSAHSSVLPLCQHTVCAAAVERVHHETNLCQHWSFLSTLFWVILSLQSIWIVSIVDWFREPIIFIRTPNIIEPVDRTDISTAGNIPVGRHRWYVISLVFFSLT